MNKKNLFIISVALNVGLIGLIFFVKSDAKSQAQETVTKQCVPMQEAAKQCNDIVQNNNVLWSLIDTTWKSPDQSKAFVKKLADSHKVPRCSGKACAGSEEEARLKTIISDNEQDRSIKVGWGSGKDKIKYAFKVYYTKDKKTGKETFVTIDANDLIGKAPDQGSEEPEEEAAE
ncbi:MAG: hypothetical protein FWC26_13030 [Fibromonadales bacterium]|nr:hypothetical protein [Fibromonadales bacterium]